MLQSFRGRGRDVLERERRRQATPTQYGLLSRTRSRGLATYASSVSFGHPEHSFFDSLDTQKFRSGFADDDNFRR